MAKQTIRIRVRRGSGGNGSYKPCGTCGGTGVVRSSNSGSKHSGAPRRNETSR